ncbi:hypothetical protein Fmac_005720 [Flemingia macrophylla]|uniref:Rhamnogalacturonan lyase domain-containing protein n=1 Tax=Flemingia macrophylla TaxID=520843 RepID=A0ABD1NBC0_9FABA
MQSSSLSVYRFHFMAIADDRQRIMPKPEDRTRGKRLDYDEAGYQFWAEANKLGHFTIENVVTGDCDLYAWVQGIFGDYKYNTTITTRPGCVIQELDLPYGKLESQIA